MLAPLFPLPPQTPPSPSLSEERGVRRSCVFAGSEWSRFFHPRVSAVRQTKTTARKKDKIFSQRGGDGGPSLVV